MATYNHSLLKLSVNIASRFTSAKSPLSVLESIYIEPKEDRTIIRASCLEHEITMNIPAISTSDKDHALCVPSKTISSYLNSMKVETIIADISDKAIVFKTKEGKTKINGIDANEFMPQIDIESGNTEVLSIDGELLKKCFENVAFAASRDEGRPVLMGILISANRAEGVSFVASDGFRLGCYKVPASDEVIIHDDKEILVPAVILPKIYPLLSKGTSITISVLKDKEKIVLKAENWFVVASLIFGKYPDWTTIIPKSSKHEAKIPTSAFFQALKQADIIARENDSSTSQKTHPATIKTEDDGSMEIYSEEEGVGNAKIKLPIKGECCDFKVSVLYVQQFIERVLQSKEEITMKTIAHNAPITLTDGDEYTYIVMPLAITN